MDRFEFNLKPVPKARAKVGFGKGYTPKPTEQYETEIARLTEAQRTRETLTSRIAIDIQFYCSDLRADTDNLVKAILDGMQQRTASKGKWKFVLFQGAFKDDRQIDQLTVKRHKVARGAEKTEVTITCLN